MPLYKKQDILRKSKSPSCLHGDRCFCHCHSFGAIGCTDCLNGMKCVDVRVEGFQ